MVNTLPVTFIAAYDTPQQTEDKHIKPEGITTPSPQISVGSKSYRSGNAQ
jgi:hypothetical protein